jgi:hypothetical protein
MSWLQDIDLLGIEPKLYYKGSERFKTKTGAFITILAGVVTIFLSGYFLLNFLQKAQTTVLSYANGEFIPIQDTSDKTVFYKFSDVNDVPINPRVATVEPMLWRVDEGVTNSLPLKVSP